MSDSKQISSPDKMRNPSAWDQTWQPLYKKPPVGFNAPTLENEIDSLKIEFIRGFLPKHGTVIEIGCGSARLLARVGQTALFRLFAVDNSSEALQLVRNTAQLIDQPICTIRGDALKLPIRSRSFDVVLSGGLLEHFPDPEPVISEMIRILRPGGVFYADVVPRKFSIYRLSSLPRMIKSPCILPGIYESRFTQMYYKKILKSLGCYSIRCRSCGVYPGRNSLKWAHYTRWMNGTFLATLFGWYFMIVARRG
jgi:SAM-dependent methyltransferase